MGKGANKRAQKAEEEDPVKKCDWCFESSVTTDWSRFDKKGQAVGFQCKKDRRFVKYRTKDMSSETANAWKVAKIEELKSSTAKKQAFVDGERREYFEKVETGGGRVSAKQAVDAVKEDGRREETQGGIFYDDACC